MLTLHQRIARQIAREVQHLDSVPLRIIINDAPAQLVTSSTAVEKHMIHALTKAPALSPTTCIMSPTNIILHHLQITREIIITNANTGSCCLRAELVLPNRDLQKEVTLSLVRKMRDLALLDVNILGAILNLLPPERSILHCSWPDQLVALSDDDY